MRSTRLSFAMEYRAVTLPDLAERSGLPVSRIRELHAQQPPDDGVALRSIARVLEFPVGWFQRPPLDRHVTRAFVCGKGAGADPRCGVLAQGGIVCGEGALFECDGCDVALCLNHATETGPDEHQCRVCFERAHEERPCPTT